MENLVIPTLILLSLSAIIILIFAIKSRKSFSTLLLNAFMGICVLAIVDLTAELTNAYIPINPFTVGGSAVFGIPAVCFFLLLKFLFI